MDNAHSSASETLPPPSSLPKALGFAFLLVFFDAFFLDLGVFSILVVVVVSLRILLAVLRYFFAKRPFSGQQLRNFAIYIAAAVLVWVIIDNQNSLARHRGENVVAAIEAYHAKYGDYPKSLDAMAPEFLDHVPWAKYTLISNRFFYLKAEENKNNPSLFYLIIPPFHRNNYDFEKREWLASD